MDCSLKVILRVEGKLFAAPLSYMDDRWYGGLLSFLLIVLLFSFWLLG